MNPPTIGHSLLINQLVKFSTDHLCDHIVYLSHRVDKDKNPLHWQLKINVCKQAFPLVNFGTDQHVTDPYKALEHLAQRGYKKITFMVGSDRINDFSTMTKYANQLGVEFNIFSCGTRCPGEHVQGISSSKLRLMAVNNQKSEFCKWVIPGIDQATAELMFSEIRNCSVA